MKVNVELLNVFFTLFVSIFTCVIYNRFNYKNLFAEMVSSRRNNWLNEMRSDISNMLASAKLLVLNHIADESKDDNKSNYYINKFLVSKYSIEAKLNLSEKKHVDLKIKLLELEKLIDETINENISEDIYEQYENLKNQLILIMNAITKEEWEKVKKESKKHE